jgi:hypothetical protein
VVIGASPYTPPVTRATFRRSMQMSAVVAVVAVAVLIATGLGMFGLFLCVGIALGALNSWLVMRSVANFANTRPSKAKFSGSVLGRLAVITVLAFACALLFRPAGIAVFGGLAVFQFLAIVSSMLPLIKEIRKR